VESGTWCRPTLTKSIVEFRGGGREAGIAHDEKGGSDSDSGVPTIVANRTHSPEAPGRITQTSSTGESPGPVPRSEPLSSGTTTSKPEKATQRI